MTECRRCERKATLYLCNYCIDTLRTQLRELPWWLDRLAETALGQAKLSDGGRRATRRDVLHGDDSLASHIEPLRACKCAEDAECLCNVDKARKRRERDALHHILAAGRVNARASAEYDRIQNRLGTWIRDICETRGMGLPQLNTASSMAVWLAKNVMAIAGQEDADKCCDEVADSIKAIERAVNRPPPARSIGPCITDPAPDEVLERRRDSGDMTTRCNLELSAGHKAKSVTCPRCEVTHPDVEEVLQQNIAEMGGMNFTVRQLVDVVLPKLDEPVPQRTLERWVEHGWIEVRGELRGAAMVRLDDVRELRRSRPRNRKAG
ncbi:hypothetical protein [Mycolicibacterium gilvum]|uniref:hypothetical protein n=1 Tax=Mycolicibacterium gilvum TaxID=1804 RepID=UPI004045DAC6